MPPKECPACHTECEWIEKMGGWVCEFCRHFIAKTKETP